MRLLVLLALFVNLFLEAYGQGFFGTAPADLGRSHTPKPFFNHANIQLEPIKNHEAHS